MFLSCSPRNVKDVTVGGHFTRIYPPSVAPRTWARPTLRPSLMHDIRLWVGMDEHKVAGGAHRGEVTYVRPDGEEVIVEVTDGTSVMQAALANDISEIVAECGGTLACATCHVYVDQDDLDRLSTPSTDEGEADRLHRLSPPAQFQAQLPNHRRTRTGWSGRAIAADTVLMSTPTIVIAGAGQAGSRTAASLRELGFAGSGGPRRRRTHLPYQRPPLSKGHLTGAASRDNLWLHPSTFYDHHDIDLRLSKRVNRIDRPQQPS